MTRVVESAESSSPVVTRAVAAGLNNAFTENYHFAGWQKQVLTLLGNLPPGIGRATISQFQRFSGLPASVLQHFSLDELIDSRLSDYAHLDRNFPAILVGPALGGATTSLALSAGGPYLPQAFVLTLRGGSQDGDLAQYFWRSYDAALAIARNDPRLITIQHYDPIHDGWLTRYTNHLRFKLIDLPDQYQQFIRQKLQPGGALIYLDCGASWLRYRVGPRSTFQVGGWGDIPAEEFLSASKRIRKYAKQSGLKYTNWRMTEFPLERGPESEWGSEPGLAEALQHFCQQHGYQFVKISLPHPHDFSRLAFAATIKLLEKEGRPPQGTLVECFSQFDATAARLGGLLPLWLIFNTQDSARFLKEMSPHFPKGKPIFFSPLATFSITPDMAGWDDWLEALGGREFINIGARQSHYPADARALLEWNQPLLKWVEEHRQPVKAILDANELFSLSQKLPGGLL